MKKWIFILSIISIIGCTQRSNHEKMSDKEKEELRIDTKILRSLHDSLNKTGDYQYYDKYILKIDEMIKKYPDPYRRNHIKVKESMKEIWGSNAELSIPVK